MITPQWSSVFQERFLLMDLALQLLPPMRRIPYFFMSVRRTHDADILRWIELPYVLWGWSFSYWLRGWFLDLDIFLYPFTLRMMSLEVCLPCEVNLLLNKVCGLFYKVCCVAYLISFLAWPSIPFACSRKSLEMSRVGLLSSYSPP